MMAKYGPEEMIVTPAPPGTDVAGELRAAGKKKALVALGFIEDVARAIRAENFHEALLKTQLATSAIINASIAEQTAERYASAVVPEPPNGNHTEPR